MTSKKKAKNDFEFDTAEQLARRVLDTDYFGETDAAAIPARFVPGEGNLIVVVGPNAGGKSFFRRVASAVCREAKVEMMPISMEGRSREGIVRGFVYGTEEWEATGVNSIRTVTVGISTCRSRETPHVILWDEPDIRLSEANAASVGKALADFTREPGKHTKASIVVTHRKALVTQLLPLRPHYLHLGAAESPETLQAWVDAEPVIRPLEDILEDSRTRYKKIQTILNDRKRSKE
jgi:hypothetical protein